MAEKRKKINSTRLKKLKAMQVKLSIINEGRPGKGTRNEKKYI